MKRKEYVERVRQEYPHAEVQPEGWDRYGIYEVLNDGKQSRVPGRSCMSEISAWKSAYNAIIKKQP